MREFEQFEPFRPHPLVRGGHLQTIAMTFGKAAESRPASKRHLVDLQDGDQLVLHDDEPPAWQSEHPVAVLIHGLGGCHRAAYMLRMTDRLHEIGIRTLRADMRGCGEAFNLASNLNHAGRSEDVFKIIQFAHSLSQQSPIIPIGVSLGGNQLLKLLGDWGANLIKHDRAMKQITTAIAVAPPVDLIHCSNNMQRWHMKPYNMYFIRNLLKNIPNRVSQSDAFKALDLSRRPKTLFQLDDRITAPLSGFSGAIEYYQQASAIDRLRNNPVPTLVIASRDDPIVPIGSIDKAAWSSQTRLEVTSGGGHVGYLSTARQRNWLDRRIAHWLTSFLGSVPGQSI